MFEGLYRVIQFAFGDLNLHRIMANHLPENTRSANLLKRLEFMTEGLARDYLLLGDERGGGWKDHILTSKINPTWRPLT